MSVKEKLIVFIESLGLGNSQFEKNCGISNGYVNNIRKSIGEDVLKKIENKYPQLNKLWLLHGEGEMLKTGSQTKHLERRIEDLELDVKFLKQTVVSLQKISSDTPKNGLPSSKTQIVKPVK